VEALAWEEIAQIKKSQFGWIEHGGDRKSEDFKNQILLDNNCFSQEKLAKEFWRRRTFHREKTDRRKRQEPVKATVKPKETKQPL